MPYATFERFELRLTRRDALDCSQPAKDASEDVEHVLRKPYVQRQLYAIGDAAIAAELKGYGAWDETELADFRQNRARIVWIAAGNIREDLHQ